MGAELNFDFKEYTKEYGQQSHLKYKRSYHLHLKSSLAKNESNK